MDDDIDILRKMINDSNNIVFFGGAGVSTESGIPDFRSSRGLYNSGKYMGRSPEEIISRSFFDRYPKLFYDFYKEKLIFKDAKPNKAHVALANLENAGKLKAVITQNIDGLHQDAGSKVVYELHGSVRRNYCMDCGKSYDLDYILNADGVPKCSSCGGTVKPDVVLYEEPLDMDIFGLAERAVMNADMLIIGGTSLVVYPAAQLVNYYRGRKLVVINKDDTSSDSKADLVIHDAIGKVLGSAVD